MKCIVVRIAKDSSFLMPKEQLADSRVELVDIPSNKKPLPAAYNGVLDSARARKELPDWIVYMHADVALDMKQLLDDLEAYSSSYDAIGLCGCSKLSVNESPLNWFTGSRRHLEGRWGCVSHGEDSGKTAFYSKHTPDAKHHSAACIDGLLIAVGKRIIEDSSFKFDEQFSFSCYDTDFSLQCTIGRGLKLGVLVEKSLKHYSVGKSILGKDFLESEILLRKKWDLGFPEGSKAKQLLTSASLQ